MGTGQYLDALAEVKPGQEAELPALMAASATSPHHQDQRNLCLGRAH